MNISALLAGLFSGILGGMGLGGGGILIIYLSLFTETRQLTAQGINLLFFIPIGILALIIYSFKKQIKWKAVFKFSLWGLLGSVTGLYFTDFLGGKITGKLFGGLLVILGIIEIFKRKRKTVDKSEKK